jgi:DNA primase
VASIPTETIEQVAAANDIVDVIGAYFPLRRAGSNFKALCPFHQEKTPSFHVNPQRQTFHCFGCGVGGSVFRFVMDYEHVDFPAAVRKLASRVGINVVEEQRHSGEENRQQEMRGTLLQLHAEAAEWFHHNLLKRDLAAPARAYLKKRGIQREVAERWQIGYAPAGWDVFQKWAEERGYSRRVLVLSGLLKPRDENNPLGEVYDRFRDRIMFPIHNDVGEVVAFSGRLLESEPDAAKYLNSPETPLFRKSKILFGLHRTKRSLIEANCAIVCEGQIDLIALFEAGITNVVAPQGTAFTHDQARILKRFVSEVVLCFDADSAGRKAAERSIEALLENDLIVRVLEMPVGEDPDSLIRKKGREAFEQRLAAARNFFDYWIELGASTTDLNSLGKKMELARNLAETISHIHDPLLKGEVVRKVASRLGVPTGDFEKLLTPARASWRPAAGPVKAPPDAAPAHDLAMLCLLALRDEDAAAFLREQNWKEALADFPNAGLLARILESDLPLSEPAALNAFMSTLSPAEESLVSAWLMQKMPENPARLAEEWWHGLRQGIVRKQLGVAQARIKAAQLSAGEVVNLQKQILDLTDQLHELSQFSPGPSLGS